MHSALACHFYSVPFPSHESTEVLLVLYFNSLSASVHSFQQFQIQTEFCKGGGCLKQRSCLVSSVYALGDTPCFWRCSSPED